MDHLDELSVDDLRRALDEVERKKPTQRLMVAIAYKHGVSQTDLAEWYGVERRTIYNWLRRLEERPLDRAVRDERRSGRPRKLGDEGWTQVRETLHAPPSDAGYDASTWTPALLQRHLAEAFDAHYSRPSCRRLLREAGLRYRFPDRDGGEAGSESGDWRWIPE
ncbi:MAG: helix-turn-helix domain-containing protein [Haloplanus sp.]